MKASFHEDYILIETDVIDLSELRKGKISIMYYIIEIHNTENDDIGVLMHDEAGEQVITKFDSWSKAKAQAGILGTKLQPNLSTKIVSFEDTHDSSNS
jgi:hypothetical protein